MDVSLPEAFEITRRAVRAKHPGKGEFPIYECMLASDGFLERTRAFVEKQDPDFKGR
ncbi:MAG: hypothetical protein OES46_15420 [Gammaproteobacteria bacterium]|nr:hypothetical protein [Gammaproteobacteria bacterium]